ncbi:reverse transcriptase [Phytophthora megakarya]|uniref:Reverse transcriptase n=1 Tax=Phytophthora megakarya TaxID=4795 RepID=A0A225WYJ9_9STRA|nr:reverse transcriptase [Phytophthora megakarya]
MAVLPEIPLTADIKIEDLKWLIGKGNALPPAAKGVVCDIDVGNAKPIAQRKLADLIRGLPSTRMVRASKSPWASPIVIIVKKNGVDIRPCVDYRLVNSLTQLMIYTMPLVTDLLEDLDKYRWYCSLDMASGFWVVPMTDRASLHHAVRPVRMATHALRTVQRAADISTAHIQRVLSPTGDTPDVFNDGDPVKAGTSSVLGRQPYIDDIPIGGTTWDDLCAKVERLLERREERVGYVTSGVPGPRGIGAWTRGEAKKLESLMTLEFPRTLKGLQSFLGSLNYYHRFILEFAIYATKLYSLSERDFGEYVTYPKAGNQEKYVHAKRAFEALRANIATTSMLKHFDAEKQPVLILYASDWAISAVLAQEHDGVYMPVKFTSQTLKPNELNYNITEKEILALLRGLNDGHTMLVGKTIRVLTRHTTLGWLFRAKCLQGRLSQWAAILSSWRLEVQRSTRGEEELLGTLVASITPRTHVDTTLEEIAPRTRVPRTATIPVLKIGAAERLYVELPKRDVVRAVSGSAEGLTVNKAEYQGILLAYSLLDGLEATHLVAVRR